MSAEIFDFDDFYSKLYKSSVSNIRYFGCRFPEDCGEDVLTKYLYRLIKVRKAEYKEGKILLNFPDTTSQLPFFKNRLRLRLRRNRSRCKVCPFRWVCTERESSGEDEDDQRTDSAILIDPSNPEQLYEQKELFETFYKTVPPNRRDEFFNNVVLGKTEVEIAEELGITPEAERKRTERWRSEVAQKLRNTIFRRNKK